MVRSICGVKRARARRRDTVARMARRYRVSQHNFRRWNKLSKRTRRLRRGRRYVVKRSPFHNTRLHGGQLLGPVKGVLAMQRPERGWGKPLMVETIRAAARAVQRSAPTRSHLVVGDLSKRGGGCLPPHKSHRGGLDIDIGYYYLGGLQRRWLSKTPHGVFDPDRTWQLLSGMLETGSLQYAFIDYGLQGHLYHAALRAGRSRASLGAIFQYPRHRSASHGTIIRHLKGHADHMHVRLRCLDKSCGLSAPLRERVASAAGARRVRGGRESHVGQLAGRPQTRQKKRRRFH